MPHTRHLQLTAIFLILLAGFLWSQRLGQQAYESSQHQRDNFLAEQLAVVEKKVSAYEDPIQLVTFGRKFLSAGNPHFAIVPLERATALQSDYRDAWYLLGYSYSQAANDTTDPIAKQQALEKAAEALQAAKAIDPEHQLTNDLLRQLGS